MTALTPAERVRRSEAKARESGAMRLPGGTLNPEATKALTRLLRKGYADSLTACIARALIEASKRTK